MSAQVLIRHPARITTHRGLLGAAAEPEELGRVELRGARADQRLQRDAAAEHAERGAVLRRDVVEHVGGAHGARARRVLHDDGGIAGNVPAHVAGENAGIGVVAAAGAVPDRQM